MSTRYVAIDSGKFGTKVAEYYPGLGGVRKFKIRTKVCPGDFRDDAIENETMVAEIDGKVYKIGNGARGNGAELETNKQSEDHRLCTIAGLAAIASSKDVDEFYVATGLPAKDWAIVSKRCDYRDYILPVGEMSVKVKPKSDSPIITKTFKIKQAFVMPESIGALFMDEVISDITPNTITGVIDLGNLNLNFTLWTGTELIQEKSGTAELGGAILIQELSQELSSSITRCDEIIAANILHSTPDNRSLPEGLGLTTEQIERSREVIKRVLKTHADQVKRNCQARNWSLDVTKIVAIGGTSADLETELKEAFSNITVLPDSQYSNALGWLRIMCAKIPEIGDIIPLKDISDALQNASKNNKAKANNAEDIKEAS